MVRSRFVLLALFMLLPACGGDDDPPSPAPSGDSSSGDADGDEVPCELPCLNEFEKNDKKLCPDPKIDWTCTQGCCIPVFKCTDDPSCIEQGFSEGHCIDDRFDCRCEVETGQCFAWVCAVASDCGVGELCDGGACVSPDPSPTGDGETQALYILSGPRMLTPGSTGALLTEHWLSDRGPVAVASEPTWTTDDTDVVSISTDGVATGGDSAGEATLTATVGELIATWRVRNVAPTEGATLTALALVAGTGVVVSGTYAALDTETGELLSTGPVPESGVVEATAEGSQGVNLHIFGEGTDWVSWLGGSGLIHLPVPAVAWSTIAIDPELKVLAEGTEMTGTNILRGRVDFETYPKEGEFEITLNSFPLSSGLFDFSLQTLLGPDVERYFDAGHSIPGVGKTDQADIPGGVTFALDTPAIPEFHLGAGPRDRRVWTLGGRIDFDQVSEFSDTLFEAFGGDELDFNKLVGTLFPTFAEFWSALTPFPPVAGDGSHEVLELGVQLHMPLGLETYITLPPLPQMERLEMIPGQCADEGAASCVEDTDCAEDVPCAGVKPAGVLGWADAVFMLQGAVTADALFVPLGLNAGSDTSDPEGNPRDGLADANEKTPEQDPYRVPGAPLHSGLASAHTRYGVAVVAASIPSGDADLRPEGGSALLHRYPFGVAPAATLEIDDFLGFPMDSQWDKGTRTLSVGAVEGADTQRVLFKGKRGRNWTLWFNGMSSTVVPDPGAYLAAPPEGETSEDRTQEVSLVLVNSFDLEDGISLSDLAGPGARSLSDLILTVNRASFVDIRP